MAERGGGYPQNDTVDCRILEKLIPYREYFRRSRACTSVVVGVMDPRTDSNYMGIYYHCNSSFSQTSISTTGESTSEVSSESGKVLRTFLVA